MISEVQDFASQACRIALSFLRAVLRPADELSSIEQLPGRQFVVQCVVLTAISFLISTAVAAPIRVAAGVKDFEPNVDGATFLVTLCGLWAGASIVWLVLHLFHVPITWKCAISIVFIQNMILSPVLTAINYYSDPQASINAAATLAERRGAIVLPDLAHAVIRAAIPWPAPTQSTMSPILSMIILPFLFLPVSLLLVLSRRRFPEHGARLVLGTLTAHIVIGLSLALFMQIGLNAITQGGFELLKKD